MSGWQCKMGGVCLCLSNIFFRLRGGIACVNAHAFPSHSVRLLEVPPAFLEREPRQSVALCFFFSPLAVFEPGDASCRTKRTAKNPPIERRI